MGSHQNQKIRR